jgi:hypothetical protein
VERFEVEGAGAGAAIGFASSPSGYRLRIDISPNQLRRGAELKSDARLVVAFD